MRYRILISLTTLMLAACGADNRPSANGPGDSHNLSVDEMRRADIDDRRKLVQLRLGFPKDAYATQKASDSMLA